MANDDTERGNFADRLFGKVIEKRSPIIAGIDPRLELFPKSFFEMEENLEPLVYREEISKAVLDYILNIIAAVDKLVAGVKFQMAYFELLGWNGYKILEDAISFARTKDLVVILDGKRNDIGSTSEAYARSYLGKKGFSKDYWGNDLGDSLTVNPYLGSDGIAPFIDQAKEHGKGIFVLVKTSNPSSTELQDLQVMMEHTGQHLYETVASLVSSWGERLKGELGYSSVGAVVGATFPSIGKKLREAMPFTPFLVPGFGAQGASASDVAVNFDSRGLGAVINSSRNIFFAYRFLKDFSEEEYAKASRHSARNAKESVMAALEEVCKDLEY